MTSFFCDPGHKEMVARRHYVYKVNSGTWPVR
jgi:hypothetical protein